MKIDEMILKANEDGETYIHESGDFYQRDTGFSGDEVYTEGWRNGKSNHMTLQEAEKALGCTIDNDITKLIKPAYELPKNGKSIFLFYNSRVNGYGHYSYDYGLFDSYYYSINDMRWLDMYQPICWIYTDDIVEFINR